MLENIENLESVQKILILANTTQATLQVNYFCNQELILRNPQALCILRNLENLENSIKIHFCREIAANFNNF